MYVTSASCMVNSTQPKVTTIPRSTSLNTNTMLFIELANYGDIHIKGVGIETLTKIFIAHPENFLKLYENEVIIKIAVLKNALRFIKDDKYLFYMISQELSKAIKENEETVFIQDYHKINLPQLITDLISEIADDVEIIINNSLIDDDQKTVEIKLVIINKLKKFHYNNKDRIQLVLKLIHAKLCSLSEDKQKTYILLINSIESYIMDEENNLNQDLNSIADEMLESPHLEKFYRQDSLTSEYPGHNGIKNHTKAVIKNFIEHFAEGFFENTGLDPEFMIQLLCLHDIGKGIGQHSSEQHYYNKKVIETIYSKIGLHQDYASLIALLCSQDIFGNYLKNEVDLLTTNIALRKLYYQLQHYLPKMTKEQFFLLLVIYYSCDAGAYAKLKERIFNIEFKLQGEYKSKIKSLRTEFLNTEPDLEVADNYSYIPEELKKVLAPTLKEFENYTDIKVLAQKVALDLVQNIGNNSHNVKYPYKSTFTNGLGVIYAFLLRGHYQENVFVNELIRNLAQIESKEFTEQYHQHLIVQLKRKRELKEMWFFKPELDLVEYESDDESEILHKQQQIIKDLEWLSKLNKFETLMQLPVLTTEWTLAHGSNLMVFMWASILAGGNLISGNDQLEALPVTAFTGESGGLSDMNKFSVSTMDTAHHATTFWTSSYAQASSSKKIFRTASAAMENTLRREGSITDLPPSLFKETFGALSKIPVIMLGYPCGTMELLDKSPSGKNILVNEEIICARMKIDTLVVPDECYKEIMPILEALAIKLAVITNSDFFKKYDHYSEEKDFLKKTTEIARAFTPTITEVIVESIMKKIGSPETRLSMRELLIEVAKVRGYGNGIPLDPREGK